MEIWSLSHITNIDLACRSCEEEHLAIVWVVSHVSDPFVLESCGLALIVNQAIDGAFLPINVVHVHSCLVWGQKIFLIDAGAHWVKMLFFVSLEHFEQFSLFLLTEDSSAWKSQALAFLESLLDWLNFIHLPCLKFEELGLPCIWSQDFRDHCFWVVKPLNCSDGLWNFLRI